MRHLRDYRRLTRTMEHRWALRRNLAQSMIQHGRITTTLPKAKTVRPFIERLVTLALQSRRCAQARDQAGDLRARRTIHKLLADRSLIPEEHQSDYNAMSDAARDRTVRMASGRRYRTSEPKGRLAFTSETVTSRLLEKVAPKMEGRNGGYTRLVQLPKCRIGDSAPLAMLQFVGDEEPPSSVTRPRKSARRKKADARYAMAVKAAKSWSQKEREPVVSASAGPPRGATEGGEAGASSENVG